jgi:hypothetical protein
VAYYFLLGAITNIVSSLTLSFAKISIKKKNLLIFGLIASFVSNLMMGPSTIFHFPQTLFILGVGQAMLGLLNPLLLIFSLPEMVDVIDIKYADLDEQSRMKVYDMSSGLYNAILGLGQVIGPIYATAVTDAQSFSLCCDYVAISSLTLGILYLLFAKSKIRPADKKYKPPPIVTSV